MPKINKKIFPFLPGFQWVVIDGQYVVPEMSAHYWNKIVSDNTVTICCYGGYLESVLSLICAEFIYNLNYSRNIYWSGSEHSKSLIISNSICKFDQILSQTDLEGYPVPLFIDKKNNVYFNLLNNYNEIISFSGNVIKRNNESPIYKICKNTLDPDSKKYIPKIRNNEKFNNILNDLGISLRNKYVVIFPDKIDNSLHNEVCMDWNVSEIKEIISMLKSLDYTVIVCTKSDRYFNTGAKIISTIDYGLFFYLISKASCILSNSIEFILSSLFFDLKVATKTSKKLFKSIEFMDSKSEIIDLDGKSPAYLYGNLLNG